MKARHVLAAFLLAATACHSQGVQTVGAPDRAAYETHVHRLVELSCATLDCHGDLERPLRLFSELGRRTRDDLRDQPITADELDRNVASFAGLARPGEPVDEHLALLEPLAVSEGGVHHEGRGLWPDTDDEGYRCFRGWLAGEVTDPAFADACAAKTAELEPEDLTGP